MNPWLLPAGGSLPAGSYPDAARPLTVIQSHQVSGKVGSSQDVSPSSKTACWRFRAVLMAGQCLRSLQASVASGKNRPANPGWPHVLGMLASSLRQVQHGMAWLKMYLLLEAGRTHRRARKPPRRAAHAQARDAGIELLAHLGCTAAIKGPGCELHACARVRCAAQSAAAKRVVLPVQLQAWAKATWCTSIAGLVMHLLPCCKGSSCVG